MNLPAKFPYNPPVFLIFILVLPFGGAAAFFAYKAMNNSEGLIINHIITLDVAGASGFFWIMCGLSSLFIVAWLVITVQRIIRPSTLVVDEHGFEFAHGFLQIKNARIPFGAILKVEEAEISGQTFLYVTTRDGEYKIQRSWLPNPQTYDQVKTLIIARAGT